MIDDKIKEIFKDVWWNEDHVIANCEEELSYYKKASKKLRWLIYNE